jgi:hypothetical protein
VFQKGRRRCTFEAFDVQSLSRLGCECPGYTVVEGSLADAAFAQPDTGPLPKLRLAGDDKGDNARRHAS